MHTITDKLIVTTCTECTNKTEVWADDTNPLCVDCAHAQECKPPKKMSFYRAHFGGHSVAECTKCKYKSVYWECGCDLMHPCKDY